MSATGQVRDHTWRTVGLPGRVIAWRGRPHTAPTPVWLYAARRAFKSVCCIPSLREVAAAASAGCRANAGTVGRARPLERARHPEIGAWHHATVSGHRQAVGTRTRALP